MWFQRVYIMVNRILDRTKDKLKIFQMVCWVILPFKNQLLLLLLYDDCGTNSDANGANFSLQDSLDKELAILKINQVYFLISSDIYILHGLSIYPLKFVPQI